MHSNRNNPVFQPACFHRAVAHHSTNRLKMRQIIIFLLMFFTALILHNMAKAHSEPNQVVNTTVHQSKQSIDNLSVSSMHLKVNDNIHYIPNTD